MLRLSPYHHSSERSSSKFTPASLFSKVTVLFVFVWVLAIKQILKELQVSLSFSLFNFQGSALIFVQLRSTSFPCELFYSITSALICQVLFSNFLKKIFRFLTAPRLRQPYYSITSSSLCQALFLIFFKIFFACLRSGRFPAPALFPLLGGFLRSPAPVSLRQCRYFSTSFFDCQVLFSRFFRFFHWIELSQIGIAFYIPLCYNIFCKL